MEPNLETPLQNRTSNATEGRQIARWGTLVVLLGAFALTYHDTLRWLVERWFADPYMGGALVTVPLVAFALWSRREDVRDLPVRGTAWGWPFLIAGAALHMLSVWIGYPQPSAISLVPVAFGFVIMLWGTEVFKRLWAPLALLVFVTPVPLVLDPLTFPLRMISTQMATVLPQLTGIPYLVEGTTIHLPGYSLAVDIACSGLRSIWSLLFAASVFAYLLSMRWWATALIMLLALPLGMLDNAVRIDSSIVLGRIFGGQVAEGFFHQGSGTVCFFVTTLIMLTIAVGASRWGSPSEPES